MVSAAEATGLAAGGKGTGGGSGAPGALRTFREAFYACLRLHPKTRRAKKRYGCESAAVIRGTVVLVEVERLPRGERRRKPKKLWLCGGTEKASRTFPCCGGDTFVGSIWNILFAIGNRR